MCGIIINTATGEVDLHGLTLSEASRGFWQDVQKAFSGTTIDVLTKALADAQAEIAALKAKMPTNPRGAATGDNRNRWEAIVLDE